MIEIAGWITEYENHFGEETRWFIVALAATVFTWALGRH